MQGMYISHDFTGIACIVSEIVSNIVDACSDMMDEHKNT